uniref:Uncharacterized protein n=1 Tax=Amorphochlora amoebiformis TaxID=1561963 RepID=A0A7S0GNZ7_9EUKA|mmetsp:Transcript_12135/g.19241  ORF Transcript_12135/g.19241 Transcript_12135/m.19241 type:complete len:243 (+) Transcript_12135:3-731(+)
MMYLKQLQDENLRVKYSNANLTLEAEKLSGLAEVSEQELLEDMDQQLSGPTHEIERLQREISELNLDEEYKDVIDQLWCTEDDIETETDAPSDEITYNMERGLEYIRENPVNETNMNLFLKGKPHEPLTREDKVEQSRADTLKEWVNPRWGEEKGKPLWEAIPFLDSDDGLEEEMDYYHPDSPAPSVGERVLMYSSSRRGWLNATVIQLIGREDDLWIEIEYESKSKSRKRVRQEELRKILC